MPDDLPQHDALHVVSDIHMGGVAGFQVLRETARLAGYVRRLAASRPGQEVALVLNGDVFDTLAEDLGSDYLATRQALQVVGRILDDPAFAPVWAALSAFVQQPGRTLVFVIGNHDIEIAFPGVQRLLLARLAGQDLAARARTVFSTTGAGYACRVGAARVFCTHGNEFDAWNYNRYEDLARVGRRLNCGQPVDPATWRPNAGTKMVKEVMNAVKQRYRWIDLLKPETSAAVGTLMAIDPGQIRRLGELPDILAEQVSGRRESVGRLSLPAGEMAPERGLAAAAPTLEQLLGPQLRAAQGAHPPADDMLMAAEAQLGLDPAALTGAGTLGAGQLVWDRLTGWIRGVDPVEALRRALLDWLQDDRSFAIDDRDDTCRATLDNVGADVDVLVTGHTHLMRAIDLGGGRLYFNSGTWIRLMRFTEALLKDRDSFLPVYQLLQDGRMALLDEAVWGGEPLVLDCTSAVELVAEDGALVGRLQRIVGDGLGQPVTVQQLRRA